MSSSLDLLFRVAKLIACILVGMIAAWRGAGYIDPHGSAIAPALCGLFAIAIVFTGIAMLDDEEATAAE